MFKANVPHLIIPKLIEQPTWGGDYIIKHKKWHDISLVEGKHIGQSYELYGRSKILLNITDTDFHRFLPEFGTAHSLFAFDDTFHLAEGIDYVTLSQLIQSSPIPLIRINHAYGNAFQIHIKSSVFHPRWKAKAKSWFFLENGLISYGIKKGIDIEEYKRACLSMNKKLTLLSNKIVAREITAEEARNEADAYIKTVNPWQYVNVHEVKKNDLIDIHEGGIHNSWEEDRFKYPDGNIVYEIQDNVPDSSCIMRSFDKGKFKKDGGIREVHIEDYFHFIDMNEEKNDISSSLHHKTSGTLLKTPHFGMDEIAVTTSHTEKVDHPFIHLFVYKGDIQVTTDYGQVHVGQGHSCILFQEAELYKIITLGPSSVVFKTYPR